MHRILTIARFSWPFLRPYWKRTLIGILMGIFFGLSNAGVLWLTKTMLTRLDDADAPAPGLVEKQTQESSTALESVAPSLSTWAKELSASIKEGVDAAVDPWLPKRARPLDAYQFVGILVILPFLVALRSGAAYFSTYCMTWTGQMVINDVRVKVVDVLSRLSLDYYNKSTLGDLVTRINGDTKTLERCLSHGVEHVVRDPVTIVSVFAWLCFIDWPLTVSTVIFLPTCAIPIMILGRKARAASKKIVQSSVVQASMIIEMLSGIRIVKAFSLESDLVERFRNRSRYMIRQTMRSIRATELTTPIIEIVSIFGVGAILLFVVFTNRNIPDLVTFFLGLIMFYDPIKKLAKVHLLMERTNIGIHRLMEVLAEQPTVKEPQHPVRLQSFQTGLSLDKVSFAYEKNLVLQDVSFQIPRGCQLGIAGESGSGKSTLVNLLFRFFDPTQGVIRIDGHDLKTVSTANLHQLMALVSQEVVIFDQSAYDNIACGKAGATQEEVIAAARHAYAHDFIMEQPDGYQTRLGERGVKLSGGQRQRISIARAFIRNSPILILDEATAALDSQSEAEVQQALDRLAENRTVVIIAHRLSTLAQCDSVLVLSRGRLVEQGSFDELLRRGGAFAAMARKQGILAKP